MTPSPNVARSAHVPWPEIDCLSADTEIRTPDDPLGWYPGVKVILDYAITLMLLPLAAVVVGIAALAVKLTSPGPAFYVQTRLGLHGRRYRLFKIRTMYHNCEANSGIQWSPKGDRRITPLGRFLRLFHIDELPQLLNVLRGEMSLVGPRPERPEVIQAKGLTRLVPGYQYRLLVKPGLTGLAQLQLPADSDITSVRHKIVYDLYYVQHLSLWLDLRLLVATAFKALGFGPQMLRWIFFLPGRRKVAMDFQSRVTVPASSATHPALQPA
jgi:lipopolysaccharide/colanic/teichoic acid biosynthesis glycosyltransferase